MHTLTYSYYMNEKKIATVLAKLNEKVKKMLKNHFLLFTKNSKKHGIISNPCVEFKHIFSYKMIQNERIFIYFILDKMLSQAG